MTVRAQSISHVKAHFAQVIDEIRNGGGPLIVTRNGATAAIIQDYASFERTQQALAMLQLVAMGDEDVRKGRISSQAAVFAGVRKRLKACQKAAR